MSMNAKEFLKKIRKIDTQIKNKKIELKTARVLGVSVNKIEGDVDMLFAERQEIISIIEGLPEAEYDVLHKVYVQCKTLQEVAFERNISYSLTTTIHGRALKHVEGLLNEKK